MKLLDEPMGDVPVKSGDGLDDAAFVDDDLGLAQIEIELDPRGAARRSGSGTARASAQNIDTRGSYCFMSAGSRSVRIAVTAS